MPLVVELQDSKGNLADPGGTTYHVTLDGALLGGVFEGDIDAIGRLALTDVRVTAPGTVRLAAGAPGVSNATMPADLVVSPAASTVGPPSTTPAQLVFNSPPPPGTAGVPLPPVNVSVLNGNGDVLTTAGGSVQLFIPNGTPAVGARHEEPTNLALGATVLTAPVVNGVATFTANLTRAGTWNLAATWSGGLSATPQGVTVAAAATASLNFQVQFPLPFPPIPLQPAGLAIANATLQGQSGANPLASLMACEALDAFGNRNLAENRAVNLSFTSAGRALQGVTQATMGAVDAGLARFDAAAFPQGRLGVQSLTATLGAMTGHTAPFQVVLEPASSLSNGELSPIFANAVGPHLISGDGRYLVYTRATLDPFGAQQGSHVWRKDRQTGQETQIDNSPDNIFNEVPAISPNGQYVVFRSNHPGGSARQIWRWHNGTITLASHVHGNLTQGVNNHCQSGDVNDSGLVVYDTQATDVVPLPKRGTYQVYAAPASGTAVQVVSESAPGVMMDNSGFANPAAPTVSADGKVAFTAFAFDMPGYNPAFAVAAYRRDLSRAVDAGGLMLVTGQPGNPALAFQGFTQFPVISANGRYVVYFGQAFDGSQPTDDGSRLQVYRRDCDGPATALVQVSEGMTQRSQAGNGSDYASISADGRYVVFNSSEGLRGFAAAPLGAVHIYRRDCNTTALALVNRTNASTPMAIGNFGTWPSLAASNIALCAFCSLGDSVYLGPAGQVFVTWVP